VSQQIARRRARGEYRLRELVTERFMTHLERQVLAEGEFKGLVDRIAARDPNASTLRKHLLDSHTSPEDCGRVAQAAGVKTLVLSHLVPGGDATITDGMWTAEVRKHFAGTVIVGKDLMEM